MRSAGIEVAVGLLGGGVGQGFKVWPQRTLPTPIGQASRHLDDNSGGRRKGMDRQELLTRLAMELAEWPVNSASVPTHLTPIWGAHRGEWECWAQGNHTPINRADWLSERERLINKPSWDDAPEWAAWLAQDMKGRWFWYRFMPKANEDFCGFGVGFHSDNFTRASEGSAPAGHNWRETLEKRPNAKPEPKAPEWDGEGLPPVGVAFEFSMNERSWEERVMLFNDGITCLMANPQYPANRWHYKCDDPDLHFRPIRSEEDVVMDGVCKMLKDIKDARQDNAYDTCKALYLSGYRKQ